MTSPMGNRITIYEKDILAKAQPTAEMGMLL